MRGSSSAASRFARCVPTGRLIQMVFQMPQASFDPTRTVRSSVTQPLRRLRTDMSRAQQEERLRHVLTSVSLGEELWGSETAGAKWGAAAEGRNRPGLGP